MKVTIKGIWKRIKRTLCQQLDDLEFAVDLALSSHSQTLRYCGKEKDLTSISRRFGLHVDLGMYEIMKRHTTSNSAVLVENKALDRMD